MKYDISKSTAPAMPALGKGTECIKLLLSQASKDIQEPLVPMFFPVLGAHISGAEFQYPDYSWKELTGMIANLVANSGDNKGQFSPLVEAICRDFRQHDKAEEDSHVVKKKDVELLQALSSERSVCFEMWPDNDAPGERLFLQLQEVLPGLVHHQFPLSCKDFSDYYLQTKLGV